MSSESMDPAETSRAGALRMRRLARLTPLIPQATSGVHRPSGQIIYRGSTSTFVGHFISSFSPSARPRPLALPPYLGPGKELSISPTGEWIVIFHPAPSTNYQTSEGGTLAIYPSTILSPLALPQNVQPLTTFALPTDVLAIQHIYGDAPEAPDDDGERTPTGDAGAGVSAAQSSDAGAAGAGRKGKSIAKPTFGPHPPSTYSPSQGPAFLVLTSTGVILFHPQLIPPPPGSLIGVDVEPQYAYAALKCPLHTRWYATSGGVTPPDIGRVDRGWAGIVRGDEGVWFAYEDTEVHGVLRAEVVIKDGKASLLTTRMPPLPAPSTSARRVQGVIFTSVPQHALPPMQTSRRNDASSGGDGDVNMADDGGAEDDKVGQKDGALVGIVVVSRTTTPATESNPVQVQTQIATYAVQRCEVDIVDAFWEINGTMGEKADAPSAWDWYSLPQAVSDHLLPHNTLILALAPLSGLAHPRAVALLAIPPNATPVLAHIDLCPSKSAFAAAAATGTQAGASVEGSDENAARSGSTRGVTETKETMIPIDPELILGISAPCMLSPSAERGRGGQVGVLDPRKGPVFYALDPLKGVRGENVGKRGQNGEGPTGEDGGGATEVGGDVDVASASAAIVHAASRGESYADVLGAVLSKVSADRISRTISEILSRSYAAFEKNPSIDAESSLFRLQVALFSHSDVPRLALATTICRLREASRLFDACALGTDQGIAFELDAIWPLIPVAEYVISTLSSLLRRLVIHHGQSAWAAPPAPTAGEPSNPSAADQPTQHVPTHFILLLHPTLRTLLLRLLSQIRTFKSFVSTLQVAILQPESKFAPAPTMRDPRATIVAKERVVGLGWRDGVDVILWGRGLVQVQKEWAGRQAACKKGQEEGGAIVSDAAAATAANAAERVALLELNPALLGKEAIGMLDRLPCPSELLLAPTALDPSSMSSTQDHPFAADIDGITFLPLDPSHQTDRDRGTSAKQPEKEGEQDRRVRCDRCHTRTEALGWTARPGMEMGMYGKRYASGLGQSVGWGGWRGAREGGCGCGGAWSR